MIFLVSETAIDIKTADPLDTERAKAITEALTSVVDAIRNLLNKVKEDKEDQGEDTVGE